MRTYMQSMVGNGMVGSSFSNLVAPEDVAIEVLPVELFDENNVSQGTFATIQAAVDAAGSVAGPVTIAVGDGTFNENVVVDRGDLTLVSLNGRGSTTIIGDNGGGELGTIEIDPGANNVTIGGEGQGFTIVGINGNGAIEKAAIYLQGSMDNIDIIDNEIVANGDAGLVSEFSAAVTNVTIDGNEFSGQTFVGPNPGGIGFGTQFDVGNDVPRQLVVMGNGGSGPFTTSNISFTNNLVSGTAGGISADDGTSEQGNTLVTIDAAASLISGNEFTGDTARFATAIRARGPETDIIDNILSGVSRGIFVDNQEMPGTYSGNTFVGGTGPAVVFDMTPGNDTVSGSGGDDPFINAGDGVDVFILNDNLGDPFNAGDYDFSGLTIDEGVVSGTIIGPDGTDAIVNFEVFKITGTTEGSASTFFVLDGMSLQAAVDAAVEGDTIVLEDGTILDSNGEVPLVIIDGTRGSDDIEGTEGADAIDASRGRDTVDGNGGNDEIAGGSGSDTLFGGEGDDTIDGGSGSDVIGGGSGADTLTGGSGRDTFVVEAGKTGADADIITDFRSSDRVAVADAGGRDIIIRQSSDDTEILADGVLVVTLLNTRVDRVVNLVEYEGDPASIDAPTGRGRNRFRDDFDFDSFDFADAAPAPEAMPLGLMAGMQVPFESLFEQNGPSSSSMGGIQNDAMTPTDNPWMLHGMIEMDQIV